MLIIITIMKKVLSIILMVLLCMPMFAADEIYVRQSSGDTRFNISNIKEITFPSGQVVVTLTDGSTKSYSSSTFVSLRFDGNIGSGVENISFEDGISFDGITVKAPQGGISIYSTDGRLVFATDGSSADISTLENGIYIVKAGCLTSKIAK